jgi:hypothetical protein
MARSGAFLFNLEEKRVDITVVIGLAYKLTIATGVTFAPQL